MVSLRQSTSDSYDLIIIDADENPAQADIVCEWLAQRGSDTEVIWLTNRRTAGTGGQ